MKKKFVSLLIAFVMAFAISMPVMAYDALQPTPTDTQFELVSIYHWVVRGDTLESIAIAYGVSVSDILENNFAYFRDLWLRNTTYGAGTEVELEPGVRLHIGYMLEIRHWVMRGDTLANIGNGMAFRFNGVPIRNLPLVNGAIQTPAMVIGIGLGAWGDPGTPISPAQIRATNPVWFEQLDALNLTRDMPYALEESFHMLNVPNWSIQNPGSTVPVPALNAAAVTIPANTVNTMVAFTDGNPMFGSPLILRTMVQSRPDLPFGNTIPMPFGELTWLCGGVLTAAGDILRPPFAETVPTVGLDQQNSFNPWATNQVISNFALGWNFAPFGFAEANFLVAVESHPWVDIFGFRIFSVLTGFLR